MEEITLKTWDHILFFIIGVLFPAVSLMQKSSGVQLPAFNSAEKRKIYISNSMFMWLPTLVILLTWIHRQRSLGDFWFNSPVINQLALVYVSIFIGLFVIETVYSIYPKSKLKKARERFAKNTPFMPAKAAELPAFTFMAFSAGFTEEVIFRAFCIHYLYAIIPLSGSIFYVIIIVPALIFAIVHLYQGVEAVIKILAFGMLFGLIYFYTESLWIVIILHFLVDLIGGLISVFIIHSRPHINNA